MNAPAEDRDDAAPAESSASPRPTVFLDRDGTLIEERSYPVTAEDLVVLPGVPEALARLEDAGYRLVVLTNQSAVARGMIDEETLGALHDGLLEELGAEGGTIDALYYAPHHPDGVAAAYRWDSPLRKPRTGMLELALHEHPTDLARSAFVGDAVRDLFVDVDGVGARVLVRSGHDLSPDDERLADHVADDLPAAVAWLLENPPGPPDDDATARDASGSDPPSAPPTPGASPGSSSAGASSGSTG